MSAAQDPQELLSDLKTHRKNILLALYRNRELKTGELREKAKVPAGSKNHHLDLLEEWGLVRMLGRVGDDEMGERIFTLTSTGDEFVEEHLQDITPEGIEDRVDVLEEQSAKTRRTVPQLEKQNKHLRERLEEAEAELERHATAISYIKEQAGLE